MKFLNKLDRYLVENHPLLWMSKIHYVIPISVLVNAIFWFWGNFAVTTKSLRNRIDEDVFLDSYAIYGYLLATLMFIILWAASYFKKNASRHLYPLKKFYFTKLLLLLFIIFYLIGAPFISFFAGVNAKVQSLASYDELKKEIKMVNLAQAFLPIHGDGNYQYDDYFEAKNPGYRILNQDEWSNYDYYEGSYNPYDNAQNNDTTDAGYIVQCLKITTRPVDCEDSYGETYYDGFKKVPERALISENNVNYRVSQFIDEAGYKMKPEKWYDYYYYDDVRVLNLEYNQDIRAISGNRQKVQRALEKFDAFLTKHEIKHAFNSPVIAEYLVKHKGVFGSGFIDERMTSHDSYFYYDPIRYEMELNKTEARYKRSSSQTTVEDLESGGLNADMFLVDNYSLESMFDNSKRSYYWKSFYIETLTIGFVALGLAFLFLMFSFADFITFIITIPSIGVLIIINALICGLIYSVVRSDNYLFMEPVGFAIGIVITYFVLLKKKNVSRRVVHAFGYVTGFISTMLLIGIFATVAILTREQVYECNYWSYAPSTLMRWVEDPGFIFTQAFVGIVLYSFTIKKLIAKPD